MLYFDRLPVMENRTYRSAAEARAVSTGSVRLVQDEVSGLVYNQAWKPEDVVYDSDYQNEQGYSPVFDDHLDQVVGILERHVSGGHTVEIGCGKGAFLAKLWEKGFSATGLDDAYEGTDPRVQKAHFAPDMALDAGCVVLRHVLEHIGEPVRFLHDLAGSSDSGCLIYIEAPCFEWTCSNRGWLGITYEHVNYFRLGDFHLIFDRVVDSGHLFGGQYLYVIADLSSIREPESAQDVSPAVPEDFADDRSWYLDQLLTPGRNVVWGGSSKGVLFCAHMLREGASVDSVVDISPEKQGRFLALTGLEVLPPQAVVGNLTADDKVFVMNRNYLDEIVEMSGDRCRYIVYPRSPESPCETLG